MDDLGVLLFLETSICSSSQPAWPQNLRLFPLLEPLHQGLHPCQAGFVALFPGCHPATLAGKTGETGLHFLAQGQKLGRKKTHFTLSGLVRTNLLPNFYHLRGEFRYGKWSSRLNHNQQSPVLDAARKCFFLGGTNEAASLTAFFSIPEVCQLQLCWCWCKFAINQVMLI